MRETSLFLRQHPESTAAGIGLCTTTMHMQRTTSGNAGNGLNTTIKYMRGAVSISLETKTKYLRRTTSAAANKGLGTTSKYLVNQMRARVSTGPRPTYTAAGHDFCLTPPCDVAAFVINSEPHTGARPSVRLCVGPELARCVHGCPGRQVSSP
jgi:hypothetical protein